MANTKVTTGVIKDDAVGADQLASNSVVTASIVDNAITTAKINDDAILTAKISNSAITNAKMSANSVDSDQYVDGSIDTAHIGDGQITSAKLETNISIAGELTVGSHINMGDNDILKIGTSADLQLSHNGSNSFIKDTGTGVLDIATNGTEIQITKNSAVLMGKFVIDGAVTLYYAGSPKLATTSSGIDVTGTVVADGLTVDTSTLVVDATNNRVGIGTSSPSHKLTIAGNSTDIQFNYNNTVPNNPLHTAFYGSWSGIGMDQTTAGIRIASEYLNNTNPIVDVGYYTSGIVSHANWVSRMRVTSAGNVGIGLTSPAQSLDTTGKIRIRDGGNTTVPSIQMGASGVDGLSLPSTNTVAFITNSAERMRIDSIGRVLIGHTNAVGGHTELFGIHTDAASGYGMFISGNGSGSTQTAVRFFDSGASAGVVGSITFDTDSTSFNTSSDARLKDVTGEARGLEVINELNPVAYNWKADGKADEGLIAQEVKEIVPNAVSGSEEEMYQMDYSKLVVHLVKGMKEQQTQIETLKAEIQELKG